MKQRDIRRLHTDGFITAEQCQRIEAHYQLHDASNRFLMLVSLVGGILVGTGLILVIGANWDSIPDWVKLFGGVGLMVALHLAGWLCRGRSGEGRYPQAGEALHFIGALLFLGNIALVGQIYDLHSREPNAWLLWAVGISALPWILQSRALHLLSLIAFTAWFGMECADQQGWFRIGGDPVPMALLVLFALAVHGYGLVLQSTRWQVFGRDAERLGLTGLNLALFPFTIGQFAAYFLRHAGGESPGAFYVIAAFAAVLLAVGTQRDSRLSPQWRLLWLALLLAPILTLAAMLWMGSGGVDTEAGTPSMFFGWLAKLLFTLLAIAEMRLGVETGTESMVNLGIAAIAAVVISTYIALISSMAQTGLVFIGSGILLIGFGIFLERNRRRLIQSIRIQPA